MKRYTISYEFVEAVPEKLEERTLYIAIGFATAVHKCPCGCGNEVVTPLSPTDWRVTYDGVSVSLWPSIGNWSLPCQSHYWIVRNSVRWGAQWSPERIATGRAANSRAKHDYYGLTENPSLPSTEATSSGLLRRVWRWVSKS